MLLIQPGARHVDADFGLDPGVLDALGRMEERHFWHAARNRWIARALAHHGAPPPSRLLDVGCGAGAVAGSLTSRGYAVVGVDTAEVLVRRAHARVPAATFVAGSVDRLDPALGPFDVLGFFDVFEHLDDPASLLRQALRHARRGALVVASVPALRALHSAIDTLSGHKRRYELGELERTYAEAGLVGVEAHGIFRAMRPLMRLRRAETRVPADVATQRRLLRDDMRVPPFPLNQALRAACALEERLAFGVSTGKPGPSLLVVGRVPA